MSAEPISSGSRSCVLVFQGDSLTDGFRRPREINTGYQLGAGYVFLIGATLAESYPGRITIINRGCSGHTVGDLAARWQADTLSHCPDWVSILVGVNATIRHFLGEESETEEQFFHQYQHLVETTDPAKVVLVEPFLLPVGDVNADWQEHLRARQRIVRELAELSGAVWVPLQDRFSAACRRADASQWAYDGIHPTHAGAALIARAWLEVVGPGLDNFLSTDNQKQQPTGS